MMDFIRLIKTEVKQSTSTALRRVATWKLQGPPSPELEPEPVASGVEMISCCIE